MSNNTGNKRICKKCLLKEYDEKRYYDELDQYIRKIDTASRADDVLYITRLDVCKNCDKLLEGTCLACGCYVELRAAAKSARCPLNNW